MRAEQVTGVVTVHGEGAGWHPGEGVAKVVDLLAGDLVTLDQDGATTRRHVGTVAAAWRPRRGGGTVVATERGFVALDDLGVLEWGAEAPLAAGSRMNDGTCDPQGRFYCGSMTHDASAGAGVVWRLDPDRSVHRVADELTIPNGMAWSPDRATVYHVDTPRGTIDVWQHDPVTGALGERRVVVRVVGGAPDGMTVDAEGGLWVALWGGAAVHRYDPSGALTAVVDVPASQVTSCAFTGPALDTLLITTSRHGLGELEDPLAGAVFAVRPGVRGVAPLVFGG